ncbi:BTAD domain-containing putative transcriptional regulator [Streptomyces sp. NRRL S-495]|uniref:AfsR/SARP family transcriptional regulator n=1 Tax=Streptomyces sp. NRRL S-495 TaxID=1609133 RepID=UPI0005F8EC68|nr:BTAD domain-containing putative transcriptional regulator [Streptomyces sp. NRRL S-495]KJY31468.1 ATPase [Streptomyces sp. NRRL S-495]
MLFDVLGPLQVRTDAGAPVTVREAKVRALLAALLVHHGRPVPVDRLVDDLWGTTPPGNPANTLQTKVSQLRRALEGSEPGGRELVAHGPAGYLLRVPDKAVDAARFTALTGRARQAEDRPGRIRLLTEALGLWRGPAFAEFRDHDFTRAAATGLDEHRLTALEELAHLRLEAGEHLALADELGGELRVHPLRDKLRAVHMRALYRSGRQAEALASYRELADHLAEELGLDPGPELAALHGAILRQDPALDPDREAPGASSAPPAGTPSPAFAAPPRGNLPAGLTELVGRDREVAEVRALLRTARLVTLTGPGGVGKTRLALESAGAAADAFPDGVWLVELAALTAPAADTTEVASLVADTAEVASLVADALGIRDHAATGPPPGPAVDRLALALAPRELLLVLDNCEHLVQPVAELTERLLRRAPGLRVLATGREPLAISGETLHSVEPLRESDAVRLFAARAAAAAPGFVLGPANADAVAVLCARLDGIPLALELAAARVRALGVHELAERLGDRFRLLTAGRRDAPARQRTLRAVIDWSWQLLTDAERAVLRRLAVFAGGSTLTAAEQVCAAPDVPADTVLDVVGRLVERSLVTVLDDGDGPRYRLLESVAAYGLERLDEAGEARSTRRRHRVHFTELAERAEPRLHGPEQHRWLERLDREGANLRSALVDAATADGDRDAGLAVRQVNALSWYWFLRGRLDEARRALALALGAGPDPSPARSDALTRQAAFALLAGEDDRPERPLDDAGPGARWFLALAGSGFGGSTGPDRTAGLLAEFRARDDRWGIAATLSVRATRAMYRGDLAGLRRYAEESARGFDELGDPWGRLQAGEQLGILAEIAGDYDGAARLHREGARLAEELRLWTAVSFRLSRLGRIALLTGDLPAAGRYHERARRLAAEQSHRPAEQFAVTGLALGARRQGELDTAEALLLPWLEWNRRLGVDAGTALVLAQLGFVAEQRGDAAGARARHLDGLTAARRTGDPRAVALALEGLAGAHALAGRPAHAARLLGTAAAVRESVGSPLPPAERGDVDRTTARATAALGAAAFTAALHRGRALDHPAVRRLLPTPG